ncbi:MAG: cation-translocating P-type ATPase, partial [Spirochaetia bacterium]|nr:cation-translocating P-type ATPase [Spirochaetia bacterium]
MKQKEYHIDGMNCSSCTVHVEKSVKDIPGIANIQVNLLKNSLSFSYDETKTDITDDLIENRVNSAGYKATVEGKEDSSTVKENSYQKEYAKEKVKRKRQLILSISFALPLMYVAMSDMLSLPFFSFFKGDLGTFYFAMLQMALALGVLIVNGKTISSGFRTLIKGKPTMDSLIAI